MKYRKEKWRELTFGDLIFFDEYSYLVEVEKSMSFLSNQSGTAKSIPQAKVSAETMPAKKATQEDAATVPAATSGAGGTTSGASNPPKCVACNGAHTVEKCQAFASMEALAKRKALMSVGACFRCGEFGLLARH